MEEELAPVYKELMDISEKLKTKIDEHKKELIPLKRRYRNVQRCTDEFIGKRPYHLSKKKKNKQTDAEDLINA